MYVSKKINIRDPFKTLRNSSSVLSNFFSQRLYVENFHKSMAIDSSLRDVRLVPKCGISYIREDEVLSSLHGSATS